MVVKPQELVPPRTANGWKEVFTVIFDPIPTFERVLTRNIWFPAYVASVVLSTSAVFLLLQQNMGALSQSLQQLQPEQAAQARTMILFMTKVGPVVGGIVGPLVAGALMALLYGALGLFIGNSGRFLSYFAVACYARLPQVMGQTVGAVIMSVAGLKEPPNFSPIVFVPHMDPRGLFASFLASLDVFVLWNILLAVVGLGVIHKRPLSSMVVPGVTLYLVSLSMTVAVNLIASAFAP